MKIAIISDIHGNLNNLVLFFNQAKEHNVWKIIFLWDFVNNWTAKALALFYIPTFAIWWNNDWDKVAITKTSLSENSNLEVGFDVFDTLEIEWRKLFLTHYAILAKPMAKSWDFDAVFYGHDHQCFMWKIWDCLILNPWEISANKTQKSTFAIYNTTDNSAEIIELTDWIISTKDDIIDEYKSKNNIVYGVAKSYKV